jgi:hypothetical protein
MTVITGRLAEARLYLYYVAAVLRPGVRVPTYREPTGFDGNLDAVADDDLKIIIEEGRRTIDQQDADLEHIRSRAGTLLTIGLAEIAVLSALATRSFKHGPVVAILWCLSAVAIVLAIGGTTSVLTSQARMGRVDIRQVASGSPPFLRCTARGYLEMLGHGEETVRTRLTVMRDAVLLETLTALFLAAAWPFTL